MRDLSLKTTFFSEAFPLNPGHLTVTLSALRSCLRSHLFKLSKCVCVCVRACVHVCVVVAGLFFSVQVLFLFFLNDLSLTMYDSSCQCTVVLSHFLSHEGVY